MTEKRYNEIDVEQSLNRWHNDYRATVGSLKKALEDFDDDLSIGVRFDDGYGYAEINQIFELDKKYGLVILDCD